MAPLSIYLLQALQYQTLSRSQWLAGSTQTIQGTMDLRFQLRPVLAEVRGKVLALGLTQAG
jgi:hypothetical protein